MAASILKIGISQNPICDNLVGFPKSDNIYLQMRVDIMLFSLVLDIIFCKKSGNVRKYCRLEEVKEQVKYNDDWYEIPCSINFNSSCLTPQADISLKISS